MCIRDSLWLAGWLAAGTGEAATDELAVSPDRLGFLAFAIRKCGVAKDNFDGLTSVGNDIGKGTFQYCWSCSLGAVASLAMSRRGFSNCVMSSISAIIVAAMIVLTPRKTRKASTMGSKSRCGIAFSIPWSSIYRFENAFHDAIESRAVVASSPSLYLSLVCVCGSDLAMASKKRTLPGRLASAMATAIVSL